MLMMLLLGLQLQDTVAVVRVTGQDAAVLVPRWLLADGLLVFWHLYLPVATCEYLPWLMLQGACGYGRPLLKLHQ